MKLWKILVATMIALLLVSAVAMAENCGHNNWITTGYSVGYESVGDWQHTKITYEIQACKTEGCNGSQIVKSGETTEGHTYVQQSMVNPTCTAEGTEVNKCAACNKVLTTKHDKVAHEYSVWLYHVDPTCTENGYDVYQCKNCDATKNYNGTAKKNRATGHSPVSKYTAGTCLEKAKNEHYCQYCGIETAATEYGSLGTHAWVKGTTVAPTCTEKGYTNYACSVCEETAKFDYKDAEHKPVKHNYVAPTCGTAGNETYYTCENCDKIWNANWAEKSSIPTIEPDASLHEYNEYNGWTTVTAPTCTKNGLEQIECIHCGNKVTRVIETVGHTYKAVSALQAKPAGVVAGVGYVTTPSTCTTAGAGWLECTVCNEMTKSVTIPAHDHAWGAWTYSDPASCTTDMTATRKCGWNGAHTESKVVAKATGHAWQVTAGTDATCTEDGKVTRYCPVCGTNEADKKVPATGHSYKWENTVPASPAGNGKSEYKCQVCGDVADTKTIKYTKWYYNNTMTSFGPTTKELVGGNDWYRVTPVDLAVDGVYTYDLIASNKYVVGTVTISVNAGTLSVSYKAKYDVEIKDEALLIYASKADLAAGSAVTAAVGSAINTAETFGEDTKVLVSLILTGNYDAAGKAYIDADAASALAANID